jgi:hypothetical protein
VDRLEECLAATLDVGDGWIARRDRSSRRRSPGYAHHGLDHLVRNAGHLELDQPVRRRVELALSGRRGADLLDDHRLRQARLHEADDTVVGKHFLRRSVPLGSHPGQDKCQAENEGKTRPHRESHHRPLLLELTSEKYSTKARVKRSSYSGAHLSTDSRSGRLPAPEGGG